jgi:putative transposase
VPVDESLRFFARAWHLNNPPRAYARRVARPPRLLAADAFYHVTCRGVRKLPIYETDRDRALFLALLRLALRRFRWRCHTYCLMPNHFHLLAETADPNLSSGMHWLNTAYARIFNKRHGYAGHVFDRRFHSGLVEGDVQFALRARYIDLNPVRGRLCRHPADWPWSGYRFTVGMARSSFLTSSTLLSLFSRDPRRAAAEYALFVRDGLEADEGPVDCP